MEGTLRGETLFNRQDAELLHGYAQAPASGSAQRWPHEDRAWADLSMFREVARRMTQEVQDGMRRRYTTAEIELVRESGVRLFRVSMATIGVPGRGDERGAAAERQLAVANELLATASKMESERAPANRRLAKG